MTGTVPGLGTQTTFSVLVERVPGHELLRVQVLDFAGAERREDESDTYIIILYVEEI